MIVSISRSGRRREVCEWNAAIWKRVERSDRFSYRVDEEIRDLISGKRGLGKWIDWRRKKALREVAASLGQRRNVGDSRYAFADSRSFIIKKEERLVFANRPA